MLSQRASAQQSDGDADAQWQRSIPIGQIANIHRSWANKSRITVTPCAGIRFLGWMFPQSSESRLVFWTGSSPLPDCILHDAKLTQQFPGESHMRRENHRSAHPLRQADDQRCWDRWGVAEDESVSSRRDRHEISTIVRLAILTVGPKN